LEVVVVVAHTSLRSMSNMIKRTTNRMMMTMRTKRRKMDSKKSKKKTMRMECYSSSFIIRSSS
jgi:hypothetical protein